MYRKLLFLTGMAVLCSLGAGCRSSRVAPPPAVAPTENSVAPVTLNVEDVRKILVDAVKSSPQDPASQLELAMFDLKTNALDTAEQEMLACWKQFPRFSRVPYQLGLFYLTHGRLADSVRYLQSAAQLSPDAPDLQWNAGLALFQMGDEKRAIDYLKKAIKLDPQAPEPYLLLARCYDHHGTAAIAIANLKLYLERSGNPAPGYYLLGRIYSRQADRAHAEEFLQRAVQIDPNNPEYWVGLGRVYFELFNSQQAQQGITCYEKALALDPKNWPAHQYLGHALLDQTQYEAAIVHLRAAMQGSPDPGPLYYDLSQALLKAGHVEEGRKALAAYQSYRSFHEGVTRLNSAIVAAPKDRALRYTLVRFCIDHHQLGAAQSVLDEIIRQQGTDPTLDRLQAEVKASHAASGTGDSRLNGLSTDILPGGTMGRQNPDSGSAALNPGNSGSTDLSMPGGSQHGN